jgi:hypothetical protein
MRSKVVHGRKSITCANSVLPAYMGEPREAIPETLADMPNHAQVDTTFKTADQIVKSTASALRQSA